MTTPWNDCLRHRSQDIIVETDERCESKASFVEIGLGLVLRRTLRGFLTFLTNEIFHG